MTLDDLLKILAGFAMIGAAAVPQLWLMARVGGRRNLSIDRILPVYSVVGGMFLLIGRIVDVPVVAISCTLLGCTLVAPLLTMLMAFPLLALAIPLGILLSGLLPRRASAQTGDQPR